MKAVILKSYSKTADVSELIEVQEITKPTCKPNQVLVKTAAAAINPLELKMMHGDMKFISGKPPRTLGSDISGTIVEVGSKVNSKVKSEEKNWKVGDRVAAMTNGILDHGTLAEYVPVDAKKISRVPDNVSFEDAGVMPSSGVTAYYSLVKVAKLQPSMKLLINGAAGGVGSFAIQVAKVIGAEVTAVCSEQQQEVAQQAGADAAIDYMQQDVKDLNMQFDMILDLVGNLTFSQAKKLLTPKGVYITSLPTPKKVILTALTKILRGKRCIFFSVRPNTDWLDWMLQHMATGEISPVVISEYTLDNVVSAYKELAAGQATGKIRINA